MTIASADATELRLVNAPARLWSGTHSDVSDIWRARGLLRALVARDLRSRYKGSSLGWAWALVRPLVMLLVYGLAVGVFLGAGRTIPDFMVYIYSGLIAWTLFATIVTGCIASVIGNGPLIGRANFPRLLLPLAAIAAALVDFALQASVLVIGYALVKDWPSPADLLFVPRALFVLVLFAGGVGLVLSAANVYIRDVGFLTDVGLQVGFWLVPVIYSYGQVQRGAESFGWASDTVTRIYMLNPMTNVVLGFQRGLWPAATTDQGSQFAFPGRLDTRLWLFSLAAMAAAWFGMRVYVRLSSNFGQEL